MTTDTPAWVLTDRELAERLIQTMKFIDKVRRANVNEYNSTLDTNFALIEHIIGDVADALESR